MICNFFCINDIYIYMYFLRIFTKLSHYSLTMETLLNIQLLDTLHPAGYYYSWLRANHIKSLGLTKLANPTLSLILRIWFAKDIGLVSRTLHGLPFIRETLCKWVTIHDSYGVARNVICSPLSTLERELRYPVCSSPGCQGWNFEYVLRRRHIEDAISMA